MLALSPGETLESGSETDDNLVDALLLDSC
jgi:hypothetical protein